MTIPDDLDPPRYWNPRTTRGFPIDQIESIGPSGGLASLERAKSVAMPWPERAMPGSIATPERQVVVASTSI
jgi:hypothetical protein